MQVVDIEPYRFPFNLFWKPKVVEKYEANIKPLFNKKLCFLTERTLLGQTDTNELYSIALHHDNEKNPITIHHQKLPSKFKLHTFAVDEKNPYQLLLACKETKTNNGYKYDIYRANLKKLQKQGKSHLLEKIRDITLPFQLLMNGLAYHDNIGSIAYYPGNEKDKMQVKKFPIYSSAMIRKRLAELTKNPK